MAVGDACGDCGLFDHTKGKAGQCSWAIPECNGPRAKHAERCPLFTDQNGVQWLLECPEEDLPDWTRERITQMDLFS